MDGEINTGNANAADCHGTVDGRALIVTSRKGGVGKSTFSAHIGAALASTGRKILLVDCDFGVRCLDLLCGTSDGVLFDLCDAAAGRASLEDTAVNVMPGLELIASPIRERPGRESLKPIFEKLRTAYDFVIFDTPRDSLDDIASNTAEVFGDAAEAAVVMHPYDMALRAAEITGRELDALGIKKRRLVINCLEAKSLLSGRQLPIVELIDRTSIPLLGAVPCDGDIALAQSDGRLYSSLKGKNSARAFSNMASRLCGKDVPLFYGFKGVNRRRLIDK